MAESKLCRALGWPDNSVAAGSSDREKMKQAAQRAGAPDPDAFLRLAYHRARVTLDNPTVWRAVGDLADALNFWYWPVADGPGEHVRIMPGDEAEAILRRAGVRPGILGARDLGRKVERFARRLH